MINQALCHIPKLKIINPTKKTIEEYEEPWAELENGSHYSGTVKDGMPHGFGKEYRTIEEYVYTGHFFEGKWHGKGLITTNYLVELNGEFIDGYFCGI